MNLKDKFRLGFFPTPLHELKNVSKKYKDFHLYIKRDDNTGLASGGNKTRKLEYLIQEAIDNGCNCVISAGAQQSNHCRQTAAACSMAGLECHLLLGGKRPDHYNGNLLLSYLLGAIIHFTGENRKGEDIEPLKKKLESEGKKVYVVPYGGSNLIGALGFVEAVRELKEQLLKMDLAIDYLFFATSSGGTQAGLILGKELYGLNVELMPVSIDKDKIQGRSAEEIIYGLVNEGKKFLNLKKAFTPEQISLIREYNEAGYGVVTSNERTAIKELAQTEGIILDPVYTGRAFYGLMDYLNRNMLKPGSKILFWHTGGLPSNFYYADDLK